MREKEKVGERGRGRQNVGDVGVSTDWLLRFKLVAAFRLPSCSVLCESDSRLAVQSSCLQNMPYLLTNRICRHTLKLSRQTVYF